MPALDYITIQGFKSIASIEKLELRPVNVVIGANGSGKSNFLGAFAFLRAISEGRLRNYTTAAGGAEKVLHFGPKTTKVLGVRLGFREQGRYELKLFRTGDDSLFPSEEIVFPWNGGYEPNPNQAIGLVSREQGREAGISDPTSKGIEKWVRAHLQHWRVYHLNDTSSSSPMLKTAQIDDNRFLRPDGSNLAAILYFLKVWAADSYGLIVRTVQRVAPFFDDFLLEPVRGKPGRHQAGMEA